MELKDATEGKGALRGPLTSSGIFRETKMYGEPAGEAAISMTT